MNKDIYREFNKGWYPLFDEILAKLKPFNVEISQAKEKYAELRVYVHPYIEEVEKIIDGFALKSKTICEFCGSEGTVKNLSGWMKTICENCYNDFDNITRGSK